MSWKGLAFPDAGGKRAGADRSRGAMEHRTVRLGSTRIVMPSHDPLESLSLGHADYIHPIALLENVGLHRLPDGDVAILLEFSKDPAGRRIMLLEVAQLCLGQFPILDLSECELNRFVTIALFGLHHDDAAWPSFDDRDWGQPGLVQHLRHAQFLAQQPVRHNSPDALFSVVNVTPVVHTRHLQLDFDIHARRQIQLHKGIHGFGRRLHDVHQALVRPDFKLLAGLLIGVRRALNREFLDAGRQGDWSHNFRATTTHRFHDFRHRLIQHAVIEPAEPDPNSLIHLHHAILSLSWGLRQNFADDAGAHG